MFEGIDDSRIVSGNGGTVTWSTSIKVLVNHVKDISGTIAISRSIVLLIFIS